MEIIAHRGASHDAPENTIASIRLGYEQGADAVEVDLQLTQDRQIVVIHDPNTRRTAGIGRRVAARSLAEVRTLNVGQWGRWTGSGFSEPIPALDEVVPLVPRHKRLFLEIKCGVDILNPLGTCLRHARSAAGRLVFMSFDFETILQTKQRFREHPAFWIVGARRGIHRYPPIDGLIARAQQAGLDGLNLESGFPINRRFAEAVHGAGLKLYVWTVDDAGGARGLAEAGVDGIATNRPGWLRTQLATGA